jgi:hypothetical protein
MLHVMPVVTLRVGPGVGVLVLMGGGLLMLVLVGGGLDLPVMVGARLLLVGIVLALACRCLVLIYKVAICHPSTYCYAISGTLFPISGGWPALPVPSPAAISLLLTSLGTTASPLVGPARPTCNYLFPISTHRAIAGGDASGVLVLACAIAPATASWRAVGCR